MTSSFIRPVLAVSAMALLAACGDGGAEVARTTSPAPVAAPRISDPAAPTFVQAAVTTDIFEIDAARVALERSQNYEVKQLAQKVIDTRSRAGGELRQALVETDLPINPQTSLPADKAAKVAELRSADAGSFDKLYLDAQVKAQAESLEVTEQYAEKGSTPELKAIAEKKAPEVRDQRQAAISLLDKLS
jgi:putative membrane protein